MNLSSRTQAMIFLPAGSVSLLIALAGRAYIPDFAHGFFIGLSVPLLIAGTYFLQQSRSPQGLTGR